MLVNRYTEPIRVPVPVLNPVRPALELLASNLSFVRSAGFKFCAENTTRCRIIRVKYFCVVDFVDRSIVLID